MQLRQPRLTAKIHLSLCGNAAQITMTAQYDWSLLNNKDINDKYTITLRNKVDALQKILEASTLNDKYENFVNTHIEAATDAYQTKKKT